MPGSKQIYSMVLDRIDFWKMTSSADDYLVVQHAYETIFTAMGMLLENIATYTSLQLDAIFSHASRLYGFLNL